MTGPTDGADLTPEQEQAVSDLLAGVPDEPMPADVAERLDSALRAEATGRAASAPAATVVPQAVPRQQRRRFLEVAAGVALVGGAVLVGVNVLGDPDSDLAAESAQTVQVVNSGTEYTETAFETQVAALAPTVSRSSPTSQGASEDSAPDPVESVAEPVAVQADEYLTTPSAVPVAALDECLKALNPQAAPEVVDAATYETEPALVVIYALTAGDWEAFAVGVDCSAQDEHLLRYVRIQE